MDVLFSLCIFFSRRRIWAWTITSRAVVGSSAIIRSGEQTVAWASITLWRIPPDSSCGYFVQRLSGSESPTSSRAAVTLSCISLSDREVCSLRLSPTCFSIFITGFKEVIGSWNTMAILLP